MATSAAASPDDGDAIPSSVAAEFYGCRQTRKWHVGPGFVFISCTKACLGIIGVNWALAIISNLFPAAVYLGQFQTELAS